MEQMLLDGLQSLIKNENWCGEEMLSAYMESERELRANLSGELLKLFEKYDKTLDEYSKAETDFYFAEGFRLGLRIGSLIN